MGDTAQDLRIALRGLGRTPGFTVTVLLTLALGIGANAAIFSVVDGVLLRPLPFRDPGGIVAFDHEGPYHTVSEPEFMDYRRELASLSRLAGYRVNEVNLTGGDRPERITIARISDGFLDVLGVAPALGRAFSPEEEAPRGARAPAAMISHGLWQRYFGGHPGIIGRSIQLNGTDLAIIGVLPPRFDFPSPQVAVWIPLRLDPDSLWTRNNHYLRAVGRLAAGSTVGKALAEATTIASRWTREYPDTYAPEHPLIPLIRPIGDAVVGSTRPYLLALFGGAGFVLLIACVNVANLLLIRGEARRSELGVRTALGASPARLTRQLLTENALLAGLGAGLGLFVAWASMRFLLAAAPETLPRKGAIAIDLRVLAFTLAVASATGLVFGWWPARRASRSDSMEALRRTRRVGGAIGRRSRLALVAAEVSLAVMILAGAGLLIRSLATLQAIDPGLDPSNTLTARISLPPRAYDDARSIAFVERLEERLRNLPGVTGVAAMGWTPVVGEGGTWSIWIDGRPTSTIASAPTADPQQVTAGFFRTLRIPIRAGRDFSPADRTDAPLVSIINEAMAKTLWPGVDPVGRTLKMYGAEGPWVTIVGVAADIRSSGVERPTPPTMFFPYPQAGLSANYVPRTVSLAIRTGSDPERFATPLRRTVSELDPTVPVSEVRTMETVVGTSLASRRFSITLLGAFAGLALLLAGIGIYGVVGYGVSQRTSEIGLRMALGASWADILRLVVLSEVLRVVAVGLLIGLAGAFVIGRGIRSLLVGVSATDPVTIVLVSLLLVGAGVVASIIPARRAARVDPTAALKSG